MGKLWEIVMHVCDTWRKNFMWLFVSCFMFALERLTVPCSKIQILFGVVNTISALYYSIYHKKMYNTYKDHCCYCLIARHWTSTVMKIASIFFNENWKFFLFAPLLQWLVKRSLGLGYWQGHSEAQVSDENEMLSCRSREPVMVRWSCEQEYVGCS